MRCARRGRLAPLVAALTLASPILASPVFASRALAAAPADATVAAPGAEGERRRFFDLEFHPLFSVPDAIGVCLEGFPLRRGLSIEGCASIQVFLASALNLSLIYRFPLHVTPGFSLSLGPAVGSHVIADNIRGPWIDVTVDGFASFEAVWWRETTGFQVQLGAGAMRVVWDRPEGIEDTWIPIVNLTLGFAFRSNARYFYP